MKPYKMFMILTGILFFLPGILRAVSYTIEGTYAYDSEEETLTLTTDSSEFSEISGIKEEMSVIYFHNRYLILIDANNPDGSIFSFNRAIGSYTIYGRWTFSQSGIEYVLTLDTDNSFTLSVISESSDDGDTDTEEEDDSPSSLCFIGVLK